MRKIYCSKCVKYTKFKKSKISCIWSKTLVLRIDVQNLVVKMTKYLKKKNLLKH